MTTCDNNKPSEQKASGPIEDLLCKATTATHRAVNAIRSAEAAKKEVLKEINSLTSSFDGCVRKSILLVDRLDDSVYSGRINNARRRRRAEEEAKAILKQAYSNPSENADLRLFERTVDVLRDSAIGIHREFFGYDETVDAKDILDQAMEYTYRTSAREKSEADRYKKLKNKKLFSLSDILDEVSNSLAGFSMSEDPIKEQANTIAKEVRDMQEKMAVGLYGIEAMTIPLSTARGSHTTTSGYTL